MLASGSLDLAEGKVNNEQALLHALSHCLYVQGSKMCVSQVLCNQVGEKQLY